MFCVEIPSARLREPLAAIAAPSVALPPSADLLSGVVGRGPPEVAACQSIGGNSRNLKPERCHGQPQR